MENIENIENIESPENFKITVTDKGNEKNIARLVDFKKEILKICGYILDFLSEVNNAAYEVIDLTNIYDKKNFKIEIVFEKELSVA